ncbi:MAG: hypothetical protein ABIP89_08895 [Polyangiaceae bacterium]
MRVSPFVLVAAIVGAGTIAILHAEPARAPVAIVQPSDPLPALPAAIAGEGHERALPPNHPAINGSSGSQGAPIASAAEEASITWTVPAGWKTVPNPSTMRLATYVIASPTGDTEVTVSRAGGTPDANIERWLGQFDDAGKDARTVKTIRGVKVSTVEVGGTYRGGGMGPKDVSAPRQGSALYGAIAEAPGTPYFFKMIGGKASVHAAHASFEALIASITPS